MILPKLLHLTEIPESRRKQTSKRCAFDLSGAIFCFLSTCAIVIALPALGDEDQFTIHRLFDRVVYPGAPDSLTGVPNYRIPSLVRAANGDLLAFAERRMSTYGDIGDNDLVLRRSVDGGRTWGSDEEIYTEHFYANSDPTPLVDANGRVWLFFCRDRKEFALMHSDDHGHTWSEVRSIHGDLVEPDWDRYRGSVNSGPVDAANQKAKVDLWHRNWHQRYGIGCGAAAVELQEGAHAGRLAVPFRAIVPIGEGRAKHHTLTAYSDDGGRSWRRSRNGIPFGNEAQIAELAGGRLIMNSRDGDNRNRPDAIVRRIAYSNDGGESWHGHREERVFQNPQVHAAMKRVVDNGRDFLLVTTPVHPAREKAHPYGRRNLSLLVSYDEGATWTEPQTIAPGLASYSEILPLAEGTIAVIYERGPDGSSAYWYEVGFAVFRLEWQTSKE